MKQESTKRSNKLFLWIAIAAVLVAVGVALALILPGVLDGAASNPVQTSSEPYWNVDRLEYVDEETGLCVRPKGEDDLYHILFAVNGEQVELTCADKKLVNKIDANDLMGLTFDQDGRIIDMIKIDDLVEKVTRNAFVQRVSDEGITVNGSVALNGMETKFTYTQDTKIYDVTGKTEIGAPGKPGVMDKVTVLQDAEGNVTHVFIVEAALESRVYWRLSPRMWDSTNAVSLRKPDADGYTSFKFFVDGEVVTLRTNRQDCINAIDSYGVTSCSLGLVLDENGLIVDVCNGGRAAKGMIAVDSFNVTVIDGNSFTAEALTGSKQGQSYSGVITENTKIYDMSGTNRNIGAETTLQMTDKIVGIANAEGELLYIFVARRKVDAPVYLVMNRAYNTTTYETTQKPDENGWYVIDVVARTTRMTVRTKDKEIASQIHEPVSRMIGLHLDGDVVVGTYNAGNITGGWDDCLYEYVMTMNGNIITTQLGSGKTTSTVVMAEDCETYLIGFDNYAGKITKATVQEHDRLMAMVNEKGEVCYIYILERKLDLPVYWNVGGRMWNDKTKETTRVPDADGYYVFNVTADGKKPVDVKTKDKALASFLDKFAAPSFCLKVDSNGIIKEAHHAYAGVGGGVVGSYYVVTSIEGNEVELVKTSTGATTTYTLNEDYECYNVAAGGAWLYRGEKTTLKVGDKVQSITDYYGSNKVSMIHVVDRPLKDAKVGWKVDRKYNSTTKETTRVPDAEGYYVYQVAVKGKIETYKTKDKEVANFMDSQSTAVAMNVKNGIIYRAYIPYYTMFHGLIRSSYYSVTKIEGNKIYTQNTAGDKQELTLAKNCEMYDVSTYAENFGAKTKVKVGDRIHAFLDNDDKEVNLLYVVYAYNRETDMNKPCPHCGEVVLWIPFNGTAGNGHYFMPSNYTGGQVTIGADAEGNGYDFVLDMNGHDWTCEGKAFLIWKGAKAYIYDSTGYDFTVTAKGADSSIHSGVFQFADAELTLIGGNYVFDDSKESVVYGGVMTTWSSKSVLNAVGVDFVGGTLVEHEPAAGVAKKANQGGTMSLAGGVLNFTDCSFTGGVAPTEHGGNVHISASTTATFTGCTFIGGEALKGNGGSLYVGSGTKVTLDNCLIQGGNALRGGGIAIINGANNGNLTVTNTLVTGNKATEAGAGVFSYNGKATLGVGTKITGNTLGNGTTPLNFWLSGTSNITLDGAKIDGAAQQGAGDLTITGNTVIEKAGNATFGLKINDGRLIKVEDLGDDAKIGITASGVFSQEGDPTALQSYIDSGKLYSEDAYAPISVKDNALAVGVFRCIQGHTSHEGIDCSEPIVSWKFWTDANAKAAITGWGGTYTAGEYKTRLDGTGNWILTEDVTLSASRANGGGTLRIDLNGHNVVRMVTEGGATNVFTTNNTAGTIEITDLSTEGEPGVVRAEIPEGVTPAYGYGTLLMVNKSSMKLAGRAVLDASNQSTTGAQAPIQMNGGLTFTMYGGTIKGMAATAATGSVIHGWSTSAIEIYGGEIIAVDTEKAIYAPANFTMTAGTINGAVEFGVSATATGVISFSGDAAVNGTVKVVGADSITLADDVKISELQLPSSEKITLGELGENAKVAVTASGTFSTEGDAAVLQGYLDNALITATDSDMILSVKENALHAEYPVIEYCLKGHTDHNGVDCQLDILQWQKWKKADSLPASGNYILTDHVVVTGRTDLTGELNLDLHGFNITRQTDATVDTMVLHAKAGTVLAITDTTATPGTISVQMPDTMKDHVYTAGTSGAVVNTSGNNSVVILFGGILDGSNIKTNRTGGATISVNGAFQMLGGTVKGTQAQGNGSTIAGFGSSAIDIYGGELIAGITTNGTYIGGKFTMEGGKVQGGLRVGLNASSVGTISIGGSAVVEGGVNVMGFNTMSVSGTPTLENVSIPDGMTVDFAGVTGGQITVTANGVFSTDFADEAAAEAARAYITPALAGYEIKRSEKALSMTTEDIVRCINGHTVHTGTSCTEPIVQWKYWTNETARASITSWGGTYADGEYKTRLDGTGNWILTEDVTLTNQRANGSGAALRIDLNGHDIIRNVTANTQNTRVFLVNNTYGTCITDLSTEGEAGTVRVNVAEGVTPVYGTADSYGTVVYVSNGTFKLAGRAVLDGSNLTTTSYTGCATVQIANNRGFTMYGGTVKGMGATGCNASALHAWNGGTIAIHGGEILSVANKPAVYAAANFTMTGGKLESGLILGADTTATGVIGIGGTAQITGTTAIKGCASITLSGTPTIENLNNTSGKLINATDLTGGKIGITATGVFTTNFASRAAAEAASLLFTVAEEGKVVTTSESALTVAAASELIHCVNGHATHTGVDCAEPIVQWKYWNNDNARAAVQSWGGTYNDGEYKTRLDGTGNWILIDDVTLAAARANGTAGLRIDLNGHTITRNVTANTQDTRAFNISNAGGLAITDLSTQGEAGTVRVNVAAGITPKSNYGMVIYADKGPFILAGRAVIDGSNLSTTATTGMATVQINGSLSFTMYGGTVKSLAATGNFAGAVGGWGQTTLNIHGGLITSEGTSALAVYAGKNFNMDGGKIVGGTQFAYDTSGAGTITVGGTAEIDKVILKGCESITFTGAAKIGQLTNTSGKTPVEENFTGTIG